MSRLKSTRNRIVVAAAALVATAGLTATIAAPASAGPNPIPGLNGVWGVPNLNGPARPVAWITGLNSINNTAQYAVLGADLGITWDDGRGRILSVFGDSVSFNPLSWVQNRSFFAWRSNVIFTSHTRDLSRGMFFDGAITDFPGHAKELLTPQIGAEITKIPTSAIAINGKQYMTWMDVTRWPGGNNWNTKFSAMAVSGDYGQNWAELPNTVRPSAGGNFNFQMQSLLRVGNTVYVYGTPAGRNGMVYLARVDANRITDLDSYSYWSKGKWVPKNPDVASPVNVKPTGELSVAWNAYLGKYVMLSTNPAIMMQTASSPEGPWSAPRTIIHNGDMISAYAPYIHPWSSGSNLYFTVSQYQNYNVLLARLPLAQFK